jgi:ABC-type glycerol-3-phosphate transport system substrate-binding protein
MANRISRRNFLKTAGAVTSLGVLAACTPAGAPTTGGEGEGAPAGGEIQLIWDTFRGPGTGWNEERIESFREVNPDVSIEFRPLTGSSQQDNYGKMYAMHAAGDLGDIIAFDPSHYHFWRAINADIIGPMTELMEADDLDLSQWFEQFINLQYYQGDIYGLPSWGWAGHDTLAINRLHFEEAGIEPPEPTAHDTAMDTYAEWARSFYVENERFGMAFPFSESAVAVLCRIWNTSFINEDGTQCLILDDENAQEALRWLYTLAVEENILPAPGGELDANAALLEGRITMNWAGSLNVRNFDRDIEDPAIAEAWQGLFPTREDGRFPSQIRGGTWNINAGTEYPQESYEFVKHITSFDGCLSFNLVAGQGALVRPDVLQALIDENPIHEWFIPNLENGIPAHAPANSRGREYTDAITQRIQIMMDANDPVPFEQGLEELHTAVQDVLDMEPA